MAFNTTFNNTSAIMWRSNLIGGGNLSTWRKQQTCCKSLKLYHLLLYRVHLAISWIELTILVLIGTDCTGSCLSNYHTITNKTASLNGKWKIELGVLYFYRKHIQLNQFLPFWCIFYVKQAIKTAVRDLVLHGIVSQSNRPNIINGVRFYDCCSNINCRLSRFKKASNINFTWILTDFP
jgi:hypothetical protein